MEDEKKVKLEELRKTLRKKFISMAVPMNKITYSKKNYDKLFPENKVNTPIGKKDLRKDQFSKLKIKKREIFLGATYQTYTDPIAIIIEERNGKKYKVFGKSFVELTTKKIMMAVVEEKDVGVTVHRRPLNNFLNKIKNAADLIYNKPDSGVGTAGHDSYSLNLAKGDTQSRGKASVTTNITQIEENVKLKK